MLHALSMATWTNGGGRRPATLKTSVLDICTAIFAFLIAKSKSSPVGWRLLGVRSLSGSKRLVKGRGFNDKSPRNIGHNSYSRLIRGTCENRRLSLFTASQKQKIKKIKRLKFSLLETRQNRRTRLNNALPKSKQRFRAQLIRKFCRSGLWI